MKRNFLISCFWLVLLFGGGLAKAQDFFKVIGGIPHLPAVDPTSVSPAFAGMLVYSTVDKKPMIYTGTAWETLCSGNVNASTIKDYLEVKTGIPYLSALTAAPDGTIAPGSIYLSKTLFNIQINDGNSWQSLTHLFDGLFVQNSGFSTNNGLKISKFPVLSSNPNPLGLAAGAIYINSISKAIRYYNGTVWTDISCLPVIMTIPVTSITNIAAFSGVNVLNNGGSAITLQGICWSTESNPDTTLKSKTANFVFGTDVGLFPGVISGLSANTVYHVRAYVVNGAGLVYGDEVIFTSAPAAKATITTIDISNFLSTSANSGGMINNDGGAPITARGITWSAVGDPVNDPLALKTLDGSGVGTFPSQITNLLRNTVYYVRAYAVNIAGIAYGNLLQFTTPAATAPILSSPNIKITDITDVSAVSEVNIISNGGELVTERGMSWSTDRINLVYGPSTIVNPTDIGVFSSNITNLLPSTTYYVRAYAKNAIGITFSSESSFITTSLPTLTTLKPTNYDALSHVDGWFQDYNGTIAMSGGEITSNGVSLITKKGIIWGVNSGLTTALPTKTEQGSTGKGTGLFYNYMTSLVPGTTYYVRAYAINSMGTAYGEEFSFKTPELPQLTTAFASLINNISVNSGGNIFDDGRMPVNSRGICWGLTPELFIDGTHTVDGSGGGAFISSLKLLMGSTRYYVRAYAINNVGIAYGQVETFETDPAQLAAITTTPILGSAGTTTLAGGKVSATGGAAITSRGVIWSLDADFVPDLSAVNKTTEAGGDGDFSSTITGLVPNKTYYAVAYAVNSAGVVYGNKLSFKTYTLASVTTAGISGISNISAISGGNVLSDGGSVVTVSGIVWSTTVNPSLGLPTGTQGGAGLGSFIHNLSGLLGSTIYHVRAYAVNAAGVSYGNEVSFSTSPPSAPVLTTAPVSAISAVNAQSGGLMISNGGAALTSVGIVWSRSSGFLPDTVTTNKTNQQGNGSFISTLSNLKDATTYYLRAYAANAAGLTYGDEVAFKTAAFSTLLTLKATGITSISAISGGSIISNGGSYITANGICWGTVVNPTLADSYVIAGSGSGTFNAGIANLMGSTTYYVRAFANNLAGTAYGNLESFTTAAPVPPTVITARASDITGAAAKSGGNITSNGGAVLSTRGILWSIDPYFNPDTVSTNKTAETGYAAGVFINALSKLALGTTYYIRAYAINSAGTGYGEVVSFSTPILPAVTTNSPESITNTTAVVGGMVSTDGGASVSRGVIWSTVADFVPNFSSAVKIENGEGTGSFSNSLKDLVPDTKYYVRAYAMSTAGVVYGQQVSFTTYPPVIPVVVTLTPSVVTGNTAVSGGNIINEGGVTADTRGVVWSTQPGFNPAAATNKTTQSGAGKGEFSSGITGLAKATVYYVRAYATNRVGTGYGEELSFTTQDLPVLSTIAITNNTGATAVSGGVISFDGGGGISKQGICWSNSPDPTIGLSTITNDGGNDVFTSKLIELKPNTVYYVRAYAVNGIGTAYGNEISFTTLAVLPSITTTNPVVISDIAVSSGGTISNDGGAAITARGIVWSNKINFKPDTVVKNRTADGQDIGSFISELPGMLKSTSYYVRAYAVNSIGTVYGNQFMISIFPASPIVKTNTQTTVTGTSALSGGEVLSDGGAVITKRGICWSTQQNPTITLSTKTSNTDAGDGTFASKITGLLPNTQYYIRAYAENGIGVGYGLEESFITPTVPTLSATLPLTNVRATTATGGGEITDDGRSAILNRGLVWSIYSNPSIGDAEASYTTDNSSQGIGSFNANITGMKPNTTYYVRAYASNSAGTTYGSETVLKTNLVQLPTIRATSAAAIDGYSATANAEITDDGGMPVTARGLVWSTSSMPTILLSTKVVNSTVGTGIFTDVFAGLIPGTIYYVRPFATNSLGTGYGNELTFTTAVVIPSVTEVAVSKLTKNSTDGNANLVFNGGSEITEMGLVWSIKDTIPLTGTDKVVALAAGTSIFGALSNLLPVTKYYIWAYAVNAAGTGFSTKSLAFTTYSLAALTTTKPSAITQNTALSGGTITNGGGLPVLARGLCWGLAVNPTIDGGDFTSDGTTTGGFTSNITGLQPGTTYYVRAYATNSEGTAYGNLDSLFTVNVPSVTTLAATVVANIYATSGGKITKDYGLPVLSKGVIWNTDKNVVVSMTTKTNNGADTTSFSSTLSPLLKLTKYYYKAYAVNSIGAGYGQLDSLITLGEVPAISNVLIADMTTTTVNGIASVTDNGGGTVTEQGFVWNITGMPTLGDHVVPAGLEVADFKTLISGLTGGVSYYLRAFATNVIGTNYSTLDAKFQICLPVTVIHKAGINGSAVDKTVTYKTVNTNFTGENKCWITQNLGADQEAAAVNDATEAAAGWYWQFNMLQGYKVDGTTRTPGTTWNTSVAESTDWIAENDPCTRLLGWGWRIPTSTEYGVIAKAPQNWTAFASAYASVLKMHNAGYLHYSNGSLVGRGTDNDFWTSTQSGATTGIYINNAADLWTTNPKTYAFSLRCIKDAGAETVPTVTNVAMPLKDNTAIGSASVIFDGGSAVTARGLVWNNTGIPTIADNVIQSGSGTDGVFTGTLTGITAGKVYYVRAYATNVKGTGYSPVVTAVTYCGTPFTLAHKAKTGGAAIDKTVTYQTAKMSIAGTAKCWITQNLGASQQAAAVGDATEAAAGWYWQFNKLQGYKNDGTVVTPNTTWTSSISESSDWVIANDPCAQLLAGGWRLPTSAEWVNTYGAPQNWTSMATAYASVLKLHNAGYMHYSNGSLQLRGADNDYWSSTQSGVATGAYMYNASQIITGNTKAYAFTLRCLRDDDIITTLASVSNVIMPITGNVANGTATVTADGGGAVTARGLVWNTTGNPSLSDNVIAAGSGTGAFAGSINGIVSGMTYYVRAFATNVIGTTYSPSTTAVAYCGDPFTVIHTAGVNGAAADKTVTYQTAKMTMAGVEKCWITQNLGASQQAAAVGDATEAAAGWYWQFNKIQGYKHDGTTRTPATAWIASLNESSDWVSANDPCTQLLGGGWRLPTSAEWVQAYGAPQNWGNMTNAFASVLKLHNAGYLHYSNGSLQVRGGDNDFWSSTQSGTTTGAYMYNASQIITGNTKAYAFTLRCIRN